MKKRSRFLLPLFFTIALFGVLSIVERNPILFRNHDVRAELFGKEYQLLKFAASAALIFLVVRTLDAFFFGILFSRRRRAAAPTLLREIVSLVLFMILFGYAITVIFGARWTAVLTSATVLAAVIGLALQETLGNLFGGVSLHMEGTFEVGDVIRSGDTIGMVEAVTWRATRIRTVNNNFVVLPNSILARERLEVFPAKNLNAKLVNVTLSYDATPSQVIAILEQAARNVDGVSQEIPCFARMGSFGDSGVVYELKYWTRMYQGRDNIDAALRRAIWYALKRNNIEIAFPVRMIKQAEDKRPAESQELTRDAIARRLSDVEVLGPLAAEERDALGQGTHVRQYSQGETILRYGQPGDSMFVLHQGRVSIRVPLDGGASTEVAQLDSGSMFGEMALFTGEARSADVVALTDVTALEIRKDSLQPILQQNPTLASAITSKIAQRRDQLAHSRVRMTTDEQRSLLTRIRGYFGLHG